MAGDACIAAVRRDGREWRLLATRSTARLEWQTLVDACAEADLAISDRWLPRAGKPRWLKLDRRSLGRTDGVAVYLGPSRASTRLRSGSAGIPGRR